jgi:hypothetical protein
MTCGGSGVRKLWPVWCGCEIAGKGRAEGVGLGVGLRHLRSLTFGSHCCYVTDSLGFHVDWLEYIDHI